MLGCHLLVYMTRTHVLCSGCVVLCCRDLKADLVYSSQADVMIGVHGEGLFNAFFMPQHSSLIEIRPLNFSGHHSNQYMKVSNCGYCRSWCFC